MRFGSWGHREGEIASGGSRSRRLSGHRRQLCPLLRGTYADTRMLSPFKLFIINSPGVLFRLRTFKGAGKAFLKSNEKKSSKAPRSHPLSVF